MPAYAANYLGYNAWSSFSGYSAPSGSTLYQATTATPSTTSSGTTLSVAAGTTTTQRIVPQAAGVTASIPASGAAASNVGYRDQQFLESAVQSDGKATQQDWPTRITGSWSFTYTLRLSAGSLGTGFNGMTVTAIVYAVTSANATRELFRGTGSSFVPGATNTAHTDTFSPGTVTLNPGEILQYEFYATMNNTGLAATSESFVVVTGSAADITGPSTSGLFSVAATDSAPAADANTSHSAHPRPVSDSAPAADTLVRSFLGSRALTESASGADSLARVYLAVRGLTEATTLTDALARVQALGRGLSDSAPATDNLAISQKDQRVLGENAAAVDTLGRSGVFTRVLGENAAAVDTLGRVYEANRGLSESTTIADAVGRSTVVGRAVAAPAPAADSIFRQITYVRGLSEYPPGVTPDYPISFPTLHVAGVVRDTNGNPVAGATVKLYRVSDDKMVQSTTSATDGSYSFVRDTYDPYTYYVLAYLTATPQTHGVTDRGLVPA